MTRSGRKKKKYAKTIRFIILIDSDRNFIAMKYFLEALGAFFTIVQKITLAIASLFHDGLNVNSSHGIDHIRYFSDYR